MKVWAFGNCASNNPHPAPCLPWHFTPEWFSGTGFFGVPGLVNAPRKTSMVVISVLGPLFFFTRGIG